jgi:hypothetical protein
MEEWLLAFVISVCIVFIIFMILAIKTFLNNRFGKNVADIIYCIIYAIIGLTILIRVIFL